MSATVDQIPEANTLYIGEGVSIKGAVIVAETVIADGVLEGDVTVENLIVRPTGTISGRISVAGNAEIFGKVFEKLDVKGLLVLRANGSVQGTVSFGTLTLDQGANITGNVSSTDYQANQQSPYRASPQSPKSVAQQNSLAPSHSSGTTARLDLSVDLMPSPISATA
jgi:cytoskeletal protein CcmA (bactofilin family)